MKRLSVWASLLFPVLCLVVFLGCGGGGGDSNTPAALLGRVEGDLYISGGVIHIGARPLPGPIINQAPLVNATITIDGKSGSVTTNNAGHFIATDVPVGERVLHVVGGGTTLDVPLTVIGSATIPVGEFTVSRTQAIATAKTAATSLGAVSDFQIIAPQQPLPAGTVIKPALGNGRGEDDPALAVTLSSPHYLVFVDQRPGARFQHPVAYYLIDAATGGAAVRTASSWPRINGVSFYADDDDNTTSADLVQEGTRKVTPDRAKLKEAITRAVAVRAKTRDHVPGATDPKTYALLIQGNSRSDMAADLVNVKEQLFGDGGLPGPVEFSTWSPAEETNTNAREQVLKLYKDICAKARPEDMILVYISAHGSESGAFYLQQDVLPKNATIPEDPVYPEIEMNTSKCAACHVIFIIDTCFAAAQMTNMAANSPPHAAQKLTILASSSPTETSAGITRSNRLRTGRAQGGVFTNAFLNALRDYSEAHGGAKPGNLPAIFNKSVEAMPLTQNPQQAFLWDGTECGVSPPLVTVTPDSVTAKHIVGTTSCPQGLNDITLKNVSDHTVGYNLSMNSSYFNLSGGLSGSLSPGQSKSWGLSFNCGKIPPLNASIGITATAEGEGHTQTLSVPVTLNNGP